MAAAPERRNGVMTLLIVVLLLSLMGAGAGFAVGIFLQPGKEAPLASAGATSAPAAKGENISEGADQSTSSADGEAEDDTIDAKLTIVPIPPVVTTLAAPAGKWIRLEASILAQPDSSNAPDMLAERAGEQILAYLRTVRLEQIQGPSGFLAMRDDLNETVRSLSKGQVHAVLIHGLLVE